MSQSQISDSNMRLALEIGFTEAEGQQLWLSFQFYDTDSSGAIEASEFANVLRLFGVDCTDAAAATIMEENDISSDGVVSFQEFCVAARKHHKAKTEKQAELRAAFQLFDPNNTGHLSRDQLALALTSMGSEPLTEADVDTIFSLGDRDGSGDLNVDEFIRCLTMDLNELVAEVTGVAAADFTDADVAARSEITADDDE